MHLAHPTVLWLLLLLLPVLAALWRSLVRQPPAARTLTILLRCATIAALVVALAGWSTTTSTSRQYTVFLVDNSRSITPPVRQQAARFVDEARRHEAGHQSVIMPFAEEKRGHSTFSDALHTDLASALLVARAAIPEDWLPSIVLLSDGRENRGDARHVLAKLGVPVSVVPLPGMLEPEVLCVDVLPATAPVVRRPSEVEVVVQSTHADRGVVELSIGGDVLVRHPVEVRPGQHRLRVPVRYPRSGALVVQARLDGFRDIEPDNNRLFRGVDVAAEPKVLVVGNPESSARQLVDALRKAELEVDEGSVAALANAGGYGAVILSNVPTLNPHEPWLERLAQGVEQGQTLIVIGGPQAYIPGGYAGTKLEAILPVRCEARRRAEPSDLAMVVLVDCSESMKGVRIALAKEATLRAVEHLRADDQLGILAWEEGGEWMYPLARCGDKRQARKAVAKLTASGRTSMGQAIERAYLALREAFAARKHMLVLTDGVSHMADFRGLARRIAADGVTISTVAVGPEPVRPVLEEIARLGGGTFHDCPDAAAVPRVFALETLRAVGRGVVEGSLLVETPKSGALPADWKWTQPPALLGCCESRAKEDAQVLVQLSSGDPLLAWRRQGQGRVVAFTSGIQSDWAAAWRAWPGFDLFWTQLVRHVLPPPRLPAGRSPAPHPADYADELRLQPTDSELLKTIAETTGGRYDPRPEEVFAADGRVITHARPLWPYLILLAVATLLAELVLRRATAS